MNPQSKYDAILAAADFDRPAEELLLDLIHVYLDYQIPPNKIEFFEASPLDQRPDIATDEDSFVRADIDPAYDYRFPGQNGFLYQRLPSSALVGREGLEPMLVFEDAPYTAHKLLAQINRYFGVQLREQDVINDEFVEGNYAVRLRMAPGSYCFEGERLLPVRLGTPANARVTTSGQLRITTDGRIRVAVR